MGAPGPVADGLRGKPEVVGDRSKTSVGELCAIHSIVFRGAHELQIGLFMLSLIIHLFIQ